MAESSTGIPREAIDAVVKASVHWGREISSTLARVFIEAARPHLPAPPSQLPAAGDEMATQIERRWSGEGGCDCAVCSAAMRWRKVRVVDSRPSLDLTEDELAWLESAARIRADDDISTATGSGAALKVLASKLRAELGRRDAEARPSSAEATTDKPCPEPKAEGS